MTTAFRLSFSFLRPLSKVSGKALRPVALLFALAALAACDAVPVGSGNSGPRVDSSAPVPVALLIPRSSGSSSDELVATNLENAARLAMADLQGVSVDLRVYATGGNPSQAASAATQAVADGAKIILGPLYGGAANAASLAVASSGINVMSFSNNTSIAGGNLYLLGSTFQNTANRLVGYANKTGRNRIVIVHAQDVAGQLGKSAIQSAIARQGGSLAGSVDYPLSQQGVVAAVPRVKAAVDNAGANAVFMTAPSAAGLPLLAQLLPEAGVSPASTQFIGLTRWDIPAQTLDLPGLQGGWFALPDPNRNAAFASRYRQAYGAAPHPLAGLAYDGIAAIGALIQRGRSTPFSTASITQGAGFQGATGIFRFRSDGTNERGLAIASIRDRKVVVIDPAPSGFGGAGF